MWGTTLLGARAPDPAATVDEFDATDDGSTVGEDEDDLTPPEYALTDDDGGSSVQNPPCDWLCDPWVTFKAVGGRL